MGWIAKPGSAEDRLNKWLDRLGLSRFALWCSALFKCGNSLEPVRCVAAQSQISDRHSCCLRLRCLCRCTPPRQGRTPGPSSMAGSAFLFDTRAAASRRKFRPVRSNQSIRFAGLTSAFLPIPDIPGRRISPPPQPSKSRGNAVFLACYRALDPGDTPAGPRGCDISIIDVKNDLVPSSF